MWLLLIFHLHLLFLSELNRMWIFFHDSSFRVQWNSYVCGITVFIKFGINSGIMIANMLSTTTSLGFQLAVRDSAAWKYTQFSNVLHISQKLYSPIFFVFLNLFVLVSFLKVLFGIFFSFDIFFANVSFVNILKNIFSSQTL